MSPNKTLLVWLILTILQLCSVKTHHHSVIIVGAGAAGIAALTRFLAHNVSDVIVLEAEDRIGGRVNSVPFADSIVDLGPEWVDGESGNVVYEFVKDLDLLWEPESGWDIIQFTDGTALNKNLSIYISSLFKKVSKKLNIIEGVNWTTGDAFPTTYKNLVMKKFSNDPETLDLVLKCLPLMEKVSLDHDGTFSWHDSSASRTYRTVPGIQSQRWKEGKGFKEIFDVMAKNVPNIIGIDSLVGSVIHLNKVVSKINYDGFKPSVSCIDGSEYKADYVLFTPSLGVLKHDHKDLFSPSLPEKKVAAIEHLGFGSIMKIMMHYPAKWWPTDTGATGFNFVFTENDQKEFAKLFPNDPMKDGKSWISSVLGVYPWKLTNIMVFYIVGPMIPDIEQMSEDRIYAGIESLITKAFKNQQTNLMKSDKMIKTSWYSNPNFRGSFSYETVQSDDCVHSHLAEPIKNTEGKNVLFFAGEATLMGHYTTVHGAVETGHREAYRILKEMGIDYIKLE